MEARTAIIGGSGLDCLTALCIKREHRVQTRYGAPSAALLEGTLDDAPVLFLPRHGATHAIPPHRINYRANIAALREAGATRIFAVTAVGGIARAAAPGRIVIPDQIVDYTAGREHTFYDGVDGSLVHVEFSEPYTPVTRKRLLGGAATIGLEVVDGGV
ncbi:MAG: MTAP family purine nucleoside phosphorylase, partial [Gammaproteobacteria bacterium]